MEKKVMDFMKHNYSVIEVTADQLADVLGPGPHMAILLSGEVMGIMPDMGKKEAFDSPEFQDSFLDAWVGTGNFTTEEALELFAHLKED